MDPQRAPDDQTRTPLGYQRVDPQHMPPSGNRLAIVALIGSVFSSPCLVGPLWSNIDAALGSRLPLWRSSIDPNCSGAMLLIAVILPTALSSLAAVVAMRRIADPRRDLPAALALLVTAPWWFLIIIYIASCLARG